MTTEAAVQTTQTQVQQTQTPPPAEGGAGAAQSWWASLDDETKGYLQNRGLAAKTPAEAFLAASKSHREAEKLIGAPAAEVVRLPKEQNSPDWAGVWKRLGALSAAEDYKFEGITQAGNKPLEAGLVDTLRKAAFSAHLSSDSANQMAKEVVTHLDRQDASRLADATAKEQSEMKLLKDNWGANFVANQIIAASAANALGVPKEAVTALEKQVGYSKVMEMFRNIGTKIGEDRFVTTGGSGKGTGNIMTKEQAVAEKSELKGDKDWVKRFLSGGVEERRKMEALDRIISGVSL